MARLLERHPLLIERVRDYSQRFIPESWLARAENFRSRLRWAQLGGKLLLSRDPEAVLIQEVVQPTLWGVRHSLSNSLMPASGYLEFLEDTPHATPEDQTRAMAAIAYGVGETKERLDQLGRVNRFVTHINLGFKALDITASSNAERTPPSSSHRPS